jgi:SRSO17 transposase
MTKRRPTTPSTAAIDAFVAPFDTIFSRLSQRESFRHYLTGLLLPLETNKHLRGIARAVPGADVEALQHFLVDAPWSRLTLNTSRLQLLQAKTATQWHAGGVLIIDETGDRKKGSHTDYVARQYLGRIGKVDNGIVCVTSHWADQAVHYPLDVVPYQPAGRLPKGKSNPLFATKPQLARRLIEQACKQAIPFRAVVGDSFYGENLELLEWLHGEHIPYVLAVKPSHAVWQFIADPENLPAFSPIEAAKRIEREQWQAFERQFADGSAQTWYAVDLEWACYGVERFARMVVATTDPQQLPAETTWCLQTNLPLEDAPLCDVVRLYGLRDWVEVFYKQAKDELGWADWEVRRGEAILRHWHLVFCAYTLALLHGIDAPQEEKKPLQVVASDPGGWIASAWSARGCVPGLTYAAGGEPGVHYLHRAHLLHFSTTFNNLSHYLPKLPE